MPDVARHLEVSEPTYHRWRAQYGGMKADDARRLKELERENGRLKRIVAERELEDAANVIGSRPTGWWRDRPGATRRFTERVRATVTAGRLDPPVAIVLEGQARTEPTSPTWMASRLCMPGEGDDTIAAIAETHREVVVVTADRELAERVRAANGKVIGPSWLLDQLVD